MADALGYLRELAVSQVNGGATQVAVAHGLGVSDRSIRRWLTRPAASATAAAAPPSRRGRPPKLDAAQADEVLSWVGRSPCEFGFATERWTAPRVAELIRRTFGVAMNHRYVNDWLARRRVTPQLPGRVARERDDAEVLRWVRHVWPRIKKTPATPGRTWCSPTKAGC